MKRGFYTGLLIFSFTVIKANTPVFKDTLKVYPFDPVVVTGTRVEMPKKDLPMSISVISSTVIDEENYKPMLDLVSENVPGLFVTQRTNIGYGVSSGAAGQISIRGIGSFPNTQVAVLIDGRPDIMGLFGHPLSDVYFMHNIDRIEIIRGPASVLYGSNAMGGAINIIPRHKQQQGLHFYLPIAYGSYNTSQSFIRNTFENGQFGYSLSAGYRKSDGYRTDARDTYDSKSGNLELHGNILEHLKASLNSYIMNYEIYDPGQITAAADTQFYRIIRYGGDLSLRHDYKYFVSELKIHYNSGHHDIFDGYQSDDFTSGIILTETYNLNQSTRLTGGIDTKWYGGKALLYGSWIEHKVNEVSLYAIYHQKFIKCLDIDAGIRYTNHNIVGDLLIPSFGISLQLPYKITAKGSYSEGYRNPTINELYLFKPSTTEIKQETSKNAEFSLEKQFKVFLTSSITLYKTQAANLIQKAFTSTGPVYQNNQDIDITGVEWEGELLLPPYCAINWSASSSKFSSTIAESPGEKVNLAVRYKVLQNLTFGLQGQWINNLFSLVDPYASTINSPKATYVRLEPYMLFNLNANWDINKYLSATAKINNLLDVSYQTVNGFPMPGRNFTIGITAKY